MEMFRSKPEKLCVARDRDGGFTLVELLVVLVILALLAGLVGPKIIGYLGDSRAKTAKVQIASYRTALELFHIDAGRFPSTSEGLAALVTRPADVPNWRGPYLDRPVGFDPWGQSYSYRAAGEGYVLKSLGRDGKEGGSGEDADVAP